MLTLTGYNREMKNHCRKSVVNFVVRKATDVVNLALSNIVRANNAIHSASDSGTSFEGETFYETLWEKPDGLYTKSKKEMFLLNTLPVAPLSKSLHQNIRVALDRRDSLKDVENIVSAIVVRALNKSKTAGDILATLPDFLREGLPSEVYEMIQSGESNKTLSDDVVEAHLEKEVAITNKVRTFLLMEIVLNGHN